MVSSKGRKDTAVVLAWSKMVPLSEGQDPLGVNLRVSARITGQLLHCITSITPRARYFSFFPWCIGEFNRSEKARDLHADFRNGIRLRETAFTLACVLHHEGQPCEGGSLVGSKEAIKWLQGNPNKAPHIPRLRFTKNLALDAYFNSLLNLGFFAVDQLPDALGEQTDDLLLTDLELSDTGAKVAATYQTALNSLRLPNTLAHRTSGVSQSELKNWGAAGGLCELAEDHAPDRKLLREIFFNRLQSPGKSHRFRRDTLVLILELVRQFEAYNAVLDIDSFNDATYFAEINQEPDIQHRLIFPEALDDIVNRWRMFHFHYYISIALESLFVAIVTSSRAAAIKGISVEQILEPLAGCGKFVSHRLETKRIRNFLTVTPSEFFSLSGINVPSPDRKSSTALDPAINVRHPLSERNLTMLCAEVGPASAEGMACALLLLTVTLIRFVRWQSTSYGLWLSQAVQDAYKDVTAPVILRELSEISNNFCASSWRELGTFILRRFVVRQHEALGYDKSWDGSKTFFHLENEVIRWLGLSYDEIAVGNARFSSAIQILIDLAMVRRTASDEDTFQLTADGRRWLRQELQAIRLNEDH